MKKIKVNSCKECPFSYEGCFGIRHFCEVIVKQYGKSDKIDKVTFNLLKIKDNCPLEDYENGL